MEGGGDRRAAGRALVNAPRGARGQRAGRHDTEPPCAPALRVHTLSAVARHARVELRVPAARNPPRARATGQPSPP
eukprot:4439207-Pyramimonas_sp.AAC.1